jgi:hypothetical protein
MFEALWFIAVCFPLMFGGPYGKDFDPRSYHWSTTAKCSQAVLPVQALPLRACASPEDLWHKIDGRNDLIEGECDEGN